MTLAKPTGRQRNREWLGIVKRMGCCASRLSTCSGITEADHAGERPAGRKADDDTAIPMCTLHHRQRTDLSGPFKSWDRERMRAWLDQQIKETQAIVRHVVAGEGAPF